MYVMIDLTVQSEGYGRVLKKTDETDETPQETFFPTVLVTDSLLSYNIDNVLCSCALLCFVV